MARRRVLSTAAGTRHEAFGPTEWGLLAATSLIWGSSFLFIAEGLEAFEPMVVTWVRVLLGAIALGVLPRSRARIDREDWPRVILLGLVWMAFPLTMFSIAQQWVDSALAGMINGAVPLFAAAVAAILLRRLPRGLQVIGLLTGFLGVVLIAAPSLSEGGSTVTGTLLILVAVASYGLSVNLTVPLQQKYGALPPISRAQLAALVMLTPFGIAGIPASSWQWSSAFAVLSLGVLSTGLAFVAMANLVGRAGATRGAVAIYFVPIFAILAGVIFRDERVAALSMLGIALVLAGAYLSSRRET
ncbi:MAG: DMT family transporter [Acidimicrobiia bacterium]